MAQYIDKSVLIAEIKRRKEINKYQDTNDSLFEDEAILSFIDTLEVKEVDLIVHTIIAECCDWLAVTTDLSHNEIESCRNMMLTV